jgi:hypothetical protein
MTSTKIDQAEVLTDPWGRRSLTVAEWKRINEVDEIHERFGDWVVTPFGLENLVTYCSVKASRLWQGEGCYPWERQMAEKLWVNLLDFYAPIEAAREHYARAIGGR